MEFESVDTHYEVNRELVLSTSHLPEAMANRLESKNPRMFLPYYVYEYGYRIYNTGEWQDYPVELQEHIQKATELRCKWVVYDCDGPTYEEFEKYEW